MQFSSNIVNFSPSMKPFAWCGLYFQFVVVGFFHKPFVGYFIQFSSDIVNVSSTDEALYCLVRLFSCLCVFVCFTSLFGGSLK